MQPLTIHHVSVNVSDVDEAARFYTTILGGEPRDDRPELGFPGAWINLGGAQVHLIAAEVPPNRGQHFAIRVEDLDAAVTELRAKGIDVSSPVSIGSNSQSFLEDPDGNVIELHQVGH